MSSNSFSFPFHNGFDCISTDELPQTKPVLEVVSPVAHIDVHSEVERSHRTSREGLEIPMVDDVTATHVSHLSPVEHDDVHEVYVDLLQIQAGRFVEGNDMQSDSHNSPPVDRTIDLSLVSFEAAEGSLDGTRNVEKEVVSQDGPGNNVMPKVRSSSRIQQDMELWRRVKEYDQKCTESPFLPVLTRKQKQHLKKTTVGKPYKTRSTGDNSTTDQ